MRIELAWADPMRQVVIELDVPEGATIADVLSRQSSLCATLDAIPVHDAVGIHGRVVDTGVRLQEGDRLELYRRVGTDPKLLRQERVARSRKR